MAGKHVEASELSKLRKASQKMRNDLPIPPLPVKRTIEQLHEASRRLAAKTMGAQVEQIAAKNKGKYLLSRKVDVVELDRLKDIEIKAAFIAEEPLRETVEGVLEHHNDVIILSAIEEVKKETEQRFKASFMDSLEQDWEEAKKQTLELLGHPQLFAASTKEFNPRKIAEYAAVIARRQGPLLPQFIEVSRALEFRNVSLDNCWRLLHALLESFGPNDDEATRSENLVLGAKNFLESQFLEHIRNLVRQNPQVAELGGTPGTTSEIDAYLRLKNVSSPLAKVYYLIRCGQIAEAKRYYSQRTGQDLSNIPQSKKDPFHMAVYSFVNKKDSLPSALTRTWEDCMWWRLEMISRRRWTAEDLKDQLVSLQNYFDQHPPSHYNGVRNPLAWLQILLLSQQFDRAVHYFFVETSYKVEAIHFAIALYSLQKSLLRESKGEMFVSGPLPATNFDKLIRSYAPRTPNPLDYYYLLRDDDQLKECIKDHVIQTGDTSMLEYFLRDDNLESDDANRKLFRDVALRAADAKAKTGRDEDALILYTLAKKYDQVLVILNRQLGRVIFDPTPEREHWIERAREFDRTAGAQLSDRDREVRTFQKLGQLVRFFDNFRASRWRAAMEELKVLEIVPRSSVEVIEKVQNFKLLDDSIKNNVGAILSKSMELLVQVVRSSEDPQLLSDCLEWAKAIIHFAALLPGGIARGVNPELVSSMRELESYNTWRRNSMLS